MPSERCSTGSPEIIGTEPSDTPEFSPVKRTPLLSISTGCVLPLSERKVMATGTRSFTVIDILSGKCLTIFTESTAGYDEIIEAASSVSNENQLSPDIG